MRSRPGVTLVELVVALGLFAVAGAALLRVLQGQARFHEAVHKLFESRSQHSATHDLLAAEMRAVAAAAGDMERLTDSSVTYRSTLGVGLVCIVSPLEVWLAPDLVASGQTLARFRSSPQPGDTVWLFDEGARVGATDDAWHAVELGAPSRPPGGCIGTPYIDPVLDAGLSGWRLRFSAAVALPPGVTAGSFALVTRRARFVLYRSGTGEFNLGWSDWNSASGSWTVVQPVSGPFLAFQRASPLASGVAFQARDSLGSSLPPGAGVPGLAAIAIATRTATSRPLRASGFAAGPHNDSLHSLIGLRNRR